MKIKVSFSRGEILEERNNIRVEDNRLVLFYFIFSFLIYILILNLGLEL